MPGADDVDHVQVALVDGAVQMHIEKVQPRRRAPVAQQTRLDVLQRQRLLQQRIVLEIDLAHGKIVGRAPVGVHLGQQLRAQRNLRRMLHFLELPGESFFRHAPPRRTAESKIPSAPSE
jgi:hypothetical protein